MNIIQLMTCFVISNIYEVVSLCPVGWALRAQSCYFMFEAKLNRSQAVKLCQTHGAELSSLGDFFESNFTSVLLQYSSYQETGVWLGLQFHDGDWVSNSSLYPYLVGSDGTDDTEGYTEVLSTNASTLLHPFCERNYESRDPCDSGHGWVNLDSRCFKIMTSQTHTDIREACTGLSSKVFLPRIQHDFALLNTLFSSGQDIWVGGFRNHNDSSSLVTEDNYDITFIPWSDESTRTYQKNGLNTCLAVSHGDESTGFLTVKCDKELPFICERSEGTCPLGWRLHGDDCFRWYTRPDDKTSWYQAVTECKKQGGLMVQPYASPDTREFLNKALVDNDIQSMWFGFRGSKGHFLSLDKKLVVSKVYTYDTVKEPGSFDFCGVTDFDRTRVVEAAEYCYLAKNYVCTIKKSAILEPVPQEELSCDEGWTVYNDHCFKLETLATDYDNASAICQNEKATLTIIKNEMDQSFFSTPLFNDYGREEFWIGVKYNNEYIVDDPFGTARLGAFVLQNDQQAEFTNIGEYSTKVLTAKPCVIVESGTVASFPGLWKPESCKASHPFVCQKKEKATDLTFTSISWSPKCGPGWMYQDETGYCYWIAKFTFKSWSEARQDCLSMSSDLLSISNREEQAVVSSILSLPESQDVTDLLWTGAGDKGDNYEWTWSNGKPFAFFHWGEAEPFYVSSDGNNCVTVSINNDFRWETRACDETLAYICKKYAQSEDKGGNTSTPSPETCDPDILISGSHPVQNSRSFSASSYKDDFHSPSHLRLVPSNQGSWKPSTDNQSQWLQVSFASPVIIQNLIIAGDNDSYVTKLKLQYRYDEGSPWYWLKNGNIILVLESVTRTGQTATMILPNDIEASSIRVWPVEWNDGIAIKLDIMGCRQNLCTPEFAMSGPLVVRDDQISVSSGNKESWRGRFRSLQENEPPVPWLSDSDDKTPWIQVDLEKLRIVRGIKLKRGRISNGNMDKFVLYFKEELGDDLMTYEQPYGTQYIFEGLSDGESSKEIILQSSIRARVIMLKAISVRGSTNLFLDLLVCPTGCRDQPMIASLPDSTLTASATYDSSYSPSHSRLVVEATRHSSTESIGNPSLGWRPGPSINGYESYIQVDLETVVQITAVATQGSQDSWVRSYILAFSMDGQNFNTYTVERNPKDPFSAFTMIFQGNFDDTTTVKNELPESINARFVKLFPLEFKNEIILKWELYACAKLSPKNAFISCYADDSDDPDLPNSVVQDHFGVMGPDVCISHCYDKGFYYSGIQNGKQCGCGNDYGIYGPSNQCSMQCQPPFDNFTCGGIESNSVYSTGIGPKSLVCQDGWVEYRDSCYFVDADSKKTWFNAKKTCQTIKAELADVRNKQENDFISTLLVTKVVPTAWIGLNDNKQSLNFHWPDKNDDTSYTHWDYHQPISNPGLEQHGVIVNASTKGWSNVFSESYHGYVCKNGKTPSMKPKEEILDVGCDRGWHGYRNKCLQFNRMKQTWSKAVYMCQLIGSTIEVESDKFESTFISERLGFLSGKYWIGVAAVDKGDPFKDNNNKTILFSNWDQNYPVSTEQGLCVSLGTKSRAGLWSNVDCNKRHPFICQKLRDGFPPPPHPTPDSTGPCPEEWIELSSSCFKSMPVTMNWFEASEQCKEIGANLASFHSKVDLEAWKLLSLASTFWIGLNVLDENKGFTWTDKSVVDFVPWGKGQPPRDTSVLKCGEINAQGNYFGLQRCNIKQVFVCSINKGKKVKEIQPVVYPTPDPDSNACPSKSWMKFGDYCYYLSDGIGGTDHTLTWRESRAWCRSEGAYLASVNSQTENGFIQGMALKKQSVSARALWIGLNELNKDRGYSWSDGSQVGLSHENWNVNEPNDEDGFEGCVAMQVRNGKWNDEHCSLRQGFVCKKSAFPSGVTPPIYPTPTLRGHCPAGFQQLASKCYRLYGTMKGELRLSWDQARLACRGVRKDLHSDLVSISSSLENAFVTLLLQEFETSSWIGLQRVTSGHYLWSDESDVTFEHWNINEPNMPPQQKSCVYIYGPTVYAGRWNDVNCGQAAPYICQTLVDETIKKPHQLPSINCNTSLGYHEYGQSCFRLVNASVNWTQARDQCRQENAYLTSIMNAYDMAKITVLAKSLESEIWIGLNDRESKGVYALHSGYPVIYTPWAHHEPIDKAGWNCVYLNQGYTFSKGECNDDRPFVCQTDQNVPDEIPPDISFDCEDKGFHLIGSSCYSVNTGSQDAVTYDGALQACKMKNGVTLASIHNLTVTFDIPRHTQLWIGLRESLDEGFSWEDGSPLALTNWASGQVIPSDSSGVDEGCIAIDSKQQWSNMNCENKLGFICIKHKESSFFTLQPTMKSPPTVSQSYLSPSTIKQLTPNQKPTTTTTKAMSSTQTNSHRSNVSGESTASVDLTSTTSESLNQTRKYGVSSGSSALTSGETAGVVLGVLLIIAVVVVVVAAYFKREQLKKSFLRREFSKGNFESSLYQATHQDQRMGEEMTVNGPEVVYEPSQQDEGWNLSVIGNRIRGSSISYTVATDGIEIHHDV